MESGEHKPDGKKPRPSTARRKDEVMNVVEQIKDARKGKTTGGMSIREMIEGGRRY